MKVSVSDICRYYSTGPFINTILRKRGQSPLLDLFCKGPLPREYENYYEYIGTYIPQYFSNRLKGKNKEYSPIKNIDKAINRLMNLNINPNAEFEVPFEYPLDEDTIISGRIDCIDNSNKSIYEFKCINYCFDYIHYFQSAIYQYCISKEKGEPYQCFLFNIKSNELREIQYNPEIIEELLN